MISGNILDLGCGARKTPGSIGLDRENLPGVDVVHDLGKYPYPLETSRFERIVMRHAAEHVDDVIRLMEEVHRIGKPGARVEIYAPHYTSSNSYRDPTHKHHFSLFSFDFFCGDRLEVIQERFGLGHSLRHDAVFVNEDDWSGVLAGQVKLAIKAKSTFESGIQFAKVTYQVEFRSEGWNLQIPDVGYEYLEDGVRKSIILTDGTKPTQPVPLDGNGRKRADDDKIMHYRRYRVYKRRPFSVLSLP
jgi:SAM-dependent methyltransferase